MAYYIDGTFINDLPAEWDPRDYLYAIMFRGLTIPSMPLCLLCSNSPYYVTQIDGVEVIVFSKQADVMAFTYIDGWIAQNVELSHDPDLIVYYITPDKMRLVWTNFDICDVYGNLVYESYALTQAYTASEVKLNPGEVTIKSGEASEIKFVLTLLDGTVIDQTIYAWSTFVYDKSGNIVNLFDPAVGVTIQDGVLTITEKATGYSKIDVGVVMADGEVVYSYVTIKPTFDLRSWLIGYALGLAGKPMPLTSGVKEPVAYLYNGVRLPDINEVWTDKETYPYALIRWISDAGYYSLTVCGQKANYRTNVIHSIHCVDLIPYMQYKQSDNWEYQRSVTAENINTSSVWPQDKMPVVWSNYDVLNEDGTVYLKASDPIPVYE